MYVEKIGPGHYRIHRTRPPHWPQPQPEPQPKKRVTAADLKGLADWPQRLNGQAALQTAERPF